MWPFNTLGSNGERKAVGSTVSGRGGQTRSSITSARSTFLPTGQTTDRETGITGRNGQEVLDKAAAMGMSSSAIDAIAKRISI